MLYYCKFSIFRYFVVFQLSAFNQQHVKLESNGDNAYSRF